MIDTNVVVDLIEQGSSWHRWSVAAVAEAASRARLAASPIVVGELASQIAELPEILALLAAFGIGVPELTGTAGHRAGRAQTAYRDAGGRREKLLGDFLIGAHAETAGAPLLTRDARYYRAYFPELALITPEDDNG